jgi:transposase
LTKGQSAGKLPGLQWIQEHLNGSKKAMEYPKAVIEKAQKQAELLERIERGENREQVCDRLGLEASETELAALKAKYEASGRRWQALLDGRFGHSQKAHSALRAWLYERKREDESLRSPQLKREIAERFGVDISEGHINYLLRKQGLTAPPGRPYKSVESPGESEPEASQSVDNAGTFFPGSSQRRNGVESEH